MDDFTEHLDKAAGKPRKAKVHRESDIERAHIEFAKREGWTAYKFVSPARRGMPDRIYFRTIPFEWRKLFSKFVKFVEFKQPGKTPTKAQEREHARLRALGFVVEVIDYYPTEGQPK